MLDFVQNFEISPEKVFKTGSTDSKPPRQEDFECTG